MKGQRSGGQVGEKIRNSVVTIYVLDSYWTAKWRGQAGNQIYEFGIQGRGGTKDELLGVINE